MYLIAINDKTFMQAQGLKRAQKISEELKMLKPKFKVTVLLWNKEVDSINLLWEE